MTQVCLSLLGTWHGGHESEKWNAASSSTFQIVMSIQSQIMVEDPYFNGGGKQKHRIHRPFHMTSLLSIWDPACFES